MLTGEISNNGSSDIPSHPQHIRKKLYFAKNCHVFPVKYSSFLESIDQEVEWYEWTGRMRCVNKEECPGCRICLVRFQVWPPKRCTSDCMVVGLGIPWAVFDTSYYTSSTAEWIYFERGRSSSAFSVIIFIRTLFLTNVG